MQQRSVAFHTDSRLRFEGTLKCLPVSLGMIPLGLQYAFGCKQVRGTIGEDRIVGKRCLTAREWLPLAGLMVLAFIFNTSEFMPIGLLTDIGETFGASEAQTGLIVSVYAWAVMLLSLPLMMLATRIDFRRLILLVTAVFCAGQVLSAVAVSYGMLMIARLVVASAHAVFWSIVTPLAVRVVRDEFRPFALSMVVAGSAVAMIAGLPLGRAIGLAMGWRLTFACVAAVSLAILAYMAVVFPKVPGASPFGVHQLPDIFRNKALTGIYVLTALFAMGYYTGYSYIEPFLQQVGGMDDGFITIALSLFGVAGIVGSLLYSKFCRTHRFALIRLVVAGVAVALVALRFASVNEFAVVCVCLLWGASSTAFNVALQAEIIACASSDEQAVAMSVFSGIFNFGIGTGTLLGGAVVALDTIAHVGYAGGVIAFAACVWCVYVLIGR